jgi:transketolase N-terminal domain/subunit
MTAVAQDLTLVANTIRGLAMDAVQKADSGHPGMPMGMAEVAAVLWTQFLRWTPKDPAWPGRDRFVLSGGHGSMLLYSLLHLGGYPVTIDDLKQFRQLHSKTPGHPEFGDTVGVETTTGPLGQGFANAVGMAIGAQMEAARFQNPLLLARVFVTAGDGDFMEGHHLRSGVARGPPEARQPDLPVRRQWHHDRRDTPISRRARTSKHASRVRVGPYSRSTATTTPRSRRRCRTRRPRATSRA